MRWFTLIFVSLCTLLSGVVSAAPNVSYVEDICNIPLGGNNGNVTGHDVGWSTRLGTTTSYFYFGDTYVGSTLKFGTHGAKTTDTDASNCVSLSYRINNASNPFGNGNAKTLIANNPGEVCVWPRGAIANINFQMYLYYEAYGGATCGTYLGAGLARMSGDLDATRIGGYFFGADEPALGLPIRATESTMCGPVKYVYLFGIGAANDVYLARVSETAIEDPAKYFYWGRQSGADTWVTSFSAARPIFSDTTNEVYNGVSVAFNPTLNRYLAIYSCGPHTMFTGAYEICARWTNTTGSAPAALTGTWSAPRVIYHCPGPDLFNCYQAFQHDQYRVGSTIYVSAARNIGGDYWITWRKFQVTP